MHITYLRIKFRLFVRRGPLVGYQSAVQDMQINDTILVITTFRIAEFREIFRSYLINFLLKLSIGESMAFFGRSKIDMSLAECIHR